ncbi:2OG-Fe(II) oxygenase [Roseomonas sp. 18066]|uniref:2OG-Fe(II) oxygenase n=1 Tax=Roseomonas sp. 18066 TaxID=2681412 RepID=UPI00135C22C5|nr:2OG-Fe(II) oxygenase [Roseomonas sp. 18066]
MSEAQEKTAAAPGHQGQQGQQSHQGLGLGVMLPPLVLRGVQNPRYVLGSAAGRWMLLACLPNAAAGAPLEQALGPHRARFDDRAAVLFVITGDPADLAEGRLRDQPPGIRMLADADGTAFPALGFDRAQGGLLLLDPMLRVLASAPLAQAAQLLNLFAGLPAPALHAGMAELPAPVLVLPRVLEPALCRHLIGLYEQQGGEASGFMREVDGRTVLVQDAAHKKRSDLTLQDQGLLAGLRARLQARLVPALKQAFQFEATRIERYIVACYDAAEGGHFRAHRDNTTAGTAHRRFAVTINLNAEEFEGGELTFPEFGPRRYRAPTGGAVIFSCSLLHEAQPVTKGRRFAFLPFLYDEAAAALRDRNRHLVGDNLVPGGAAG